MILRLSKYIVLSGPRNSLRNILRLQQPNYVFSESKLKGSSKVKQPGKGLPKQLDEVADVKLDDPLQEEKKPKPKKASSDPIKKSASPQHKPNQTKAKAGKQPKETDGKMQASGTKEGDSAQSSQPAAAKEEEEEKIEQEAEDELLLSSDPKAIPAKKAEAKTIQMIVWDQMQLLEIFEKEKQVLNKQFPLNMFSNLFAKNQAAQNNLSQNLAVEEIDKQTKNKISFLAKKSQSQTPDSEYKYQMINLLSQCFEKRNYKIISEREFKMLLYNQHLQSVIHVFRKKKFFEANPDFITSSDIMRFIQKCSQSWESNCYLLDFMQYHQNFIQQPAGSKKDSLQDQDKEALIQFLKSALKMQNMNFDPLSLFYHSTRLLNQTPMVLFQSDIISTLFARIVFGNDMNGEALSKFNRRLSDLLLIQFKLSLNKSLLYFLVDCFLCGEDYRRALGNVSLIFLILSRLDAGQDNLSDLMEIYKQSFGEKYFQKYLVEIFPKVLDSYFNKKYVQSYSRAIQAFTDKSSTTLGESRAQTTPTYFDAQFFQQKNPTSIFFNYPDAGKAERMLLTTWQKNIFGAQSADSQSGAVHTSFIFNNKRQIIQFLEQSKYQLGPVQLVYQKYRKELLDENISEEKLNVILDQIYKSLTTQTKGEVFNVKRFLEKQKLPSHLSTKYLTMQMGKGFSTNTKHPQKSEPIKQMELDESEQPDGLIDDTQSSGQSSSLSQFLKYSDAPLPDAVEKRKNLKGQIFLNKSEIQKIKSLINKESRSAEAANPPGMAGRAIQFQKVDEFKSKKVQVQMTENLSSHSSKLSARASEKRVLSEIESTIEGSKDITEASKRLQTYMTSLPISKKDEISQELGNHQKNLIKNFRADILLYLMFIYPDPALKLKGSSPLVGRTLSCDSKDLSPYAQATVFDYGLTAQEYQTLLSVNQEFFNKASLKRIIVHIIQYCGMVDQKTISSLIELCSSQKIILSFIQFIKLFIRNKLEMQPESFTKIIDFLKVFKNIDKHISEICIDSIDFYEWNFDFSLIEPYIEMLIQNNRHLDYMMFLEKIRDHMIKKKPSNNNSQNSTEQLEQLERFQFQMQVQIHNLFREFMRKLNSHTVLAQAKQIFEEMHIMNLPLEAEDYHQGLLAHRDSPKSFNVLYQRIKTKQFKMNPEILATVFQMILTNIQELGNQFDSILKDHYYSGEIQFNTQLTNLAIHIFNKQKSYNNMGQFIRQMIKFGAVIKDQTKILLLRVITNSKEQISKGYLKGLLDELNQKQAQFQKDLELKQASIKAEDGKPQEAVKMSAENSEQLPQKMDDAPDTETKKTEEKKQGKKRNKKQDAESQTQDLQDKKGKKKGKKPETEPPTQDLQEKKGKKKGKKPETEPPTEELDDNQGKKKSKKQPGKAASEQEQETAVAKSPKQATQNQASAAAPNNQKKLGLLDRLQDPSNSVYAQLERVNKKNKGRVPAQYYKYETLQKYLQQTNSSEFDNLK